ncbi:MAG TPA: choice-of-anchor Q domain-containing protein [Solirubrobacterales bacterium]|nr:choice-of-anchor Q domain-containing protein [Solirubrobacterales bacterium]
MSRLIRLAGVLALVAACLPAGSASALSFPVTSTADTKTKGTLRASIEEANLSFLEPDTIPIEVTGTIELGSALPPIAEDITVTGPGADSLTVERTGSTPFRIFWLSGGDATFSGLTVSGGKDIYGAGFFNEDGTLTLNRVAVTGNEAFKETTGSTLAMGGGIRSYGPLTVRESVVSGNASIARGSGEITIASGGGIEAYGVTTIERSTISENRIESFAEEGGESYAEGGGLLLAGPPAKIVESTISGNSAHAYEGNPSTITRGGGLYTFRVALTGSTVTGNSAEAEDNGSAFSALGANVYTTEGVTAGATIVADPIGGSDSCGASLLGEYTSAGFNLDEDDSCGFGKSSDLSGVVAGLEPLGDNGGPTPTHPLQADSPAVDRGTSFGLTSDQRGLTRPSNFPAISDAEGGDGADIGAFELQAPPAPGPEPVRITETPADRTAPNTRIVSGPPRNTYKTKAKFRFASSEPQSSFQCRLDKKKWRACANPFKRSVKPGKHVFKVRAIDRFGNVDPTPARFGWRVKPLS